jgi:hypothetical protein
MRDSKRPKGYVMLLAVSSAPISSPFVDRDMSLLPTYRPVMFLSDLKAAARADQESICSAPPYHFWPGLAALVEHRLDGHNSRE